MEIIKDEQLEQFEFKAESHLEKVGLTLEDLNQFGKSESEIIQTIKDNFEFAKPENSLEVKRLLTFQEITEARSENLDIIENILPDQENQFAQIELEAKQMIADGKALLNSYRNQSKELAKYVRNGDEDIHIDSKNVYRIAVNGYFCYLLVLENSAKVVKVSKIADSELEKWYNESDQNKSEIFFNKLKAAK